MGTDIPGDQFDERDYPRFAERLAACLSALGQLLEQPGFGAGPATVGAELELFLVDAAARPLPHSQAVRSAVADPRVNFELNRYNLELNASSVLLAGRPFAALGGELNLLLDRVAHAAGYHAGRLALIGILPTLRQADLGPHMMTDVPRYRALDAGLRRLRQGPVRIRIAGADPLELAGEDVGLEAANTSFQVHLRVDPAAFTRTYNAVQLASAPVLAVSGNSPTFLGHRLWEETRIALYKQSVDDRPGHQPRRRLARTALGTGWLRGGPLELFAESIRLHQPLLPVAGDPGPLGGSRGRHAPPLDELRLHQGTVWRWNRAIYDPASGGHLRIEMRALPARCRVVDGPVPGPHSALVQPELVQRWRLPSGAAGRRAWAAGHRWRWPGQRRQQRLVQPDALGEQLQRPAAQPARSQGGAGHPPARPIIAAVVDRLLEHRDPGLLPQPVAQEGG